MCRKAWRQQLALLQCFIKLTPHYTDLLEICWRFQICWLTVSPASLQQIYSKSTAFCHQRICLQHLDVSICCRQICCVASKSVLCGSERTNLHKVCSMLATCCRQIRCIASKSAASRQQIASKYTANLQQIRVVWFDLNSRNCVSA